LGGKAVVVAAAGLEAYALIMRWAKPGAVCHLIEFDQYLAV